MSCSVSDICRRFDGAWFGLWTALARQPPKQLADLAAGQGQGQGQGVNGTLDLLLPQIPAMLDRFDPQRLRSPSPPLGQLDWIEQGLHQLLRGESLADAAHPAFASLPRANPSSDLGPNLGPNLLPPRSLDLIWGIMGQALPWSLSFRWLATQLPAEQLETAQALLGLWMGAAHGPRIIPFPQRSPETWAIAQQQSQQFFRRWAGHYETEEVSVS